MRSQAGMPVRPFAMHRVNAGNTVRIDITSLDFDGVREAPTALRYRIDNLTDGVVISDWEDVTPLAAEITFTLPASINVMSVQYRDTQLNQVTFQATYADGSQVQMIGCYELNAIYSAVSV